MDNAAGPSEEPRPQPDPARPGVAPRAAQDGDDASPPPPPWQTGPPAMTIEFRSNADRPSFSKPVWKARLDVHARDVRRLLRGGLRWGEPNVRPLRTRVPAIEAIPDAEWRDGWHAMRVEALVDRPRAGEAEWTATLTLQGRNRVVVAGLGLRQLAPDKVESVVAWDGGRRPIYRSVSVLEAQAAGAG